MHYFARRVPSNVPSFPSIGPVFSFVMSRPRILATKRIHIHILKRLQHNSASDVWPGGNEQRLHLRHAGRVESVRTHRMLRSLRVCVSDKEIRTVGHNYRVAFPRITVKVEVTRHLARR